MEELLRRSSGPAVHIEIVGAAGLWKTKVDASQLENSLLNLCINARDAMAPHGGHITIETANKWFDERGPTARDVEPGQYISICVTDTGSGMPAEVVAKIFDPFFTTKPLGQGTGLGLSMVYGFIRQSHGQIRVYSEVGEGTTMCLYLPRYTGSDTAEDRKPEPAVDRGSGETILVIDDEDSIRVFASEVLADNGYRVLQAAGGSSGLSILASDLQIDLLVTDVGLPGGLNGRQVADGARVSRPNLKVLVMTGYAENAIFGGGALHTGMAIITKPFDLAQFANKMRELIDAGNAKSQG